MPQEVEPTEQNEEPEQATNSAPPEKAHFPVVAFIAAIVFDVFGMIPIINFFSQPLAKLSFGLWQKVYAPKTSPFLTAILTLIADGVFLGFLPDNIAVVLYAYAMKKIEEKKETLLRLSKTRLGKYAINKFSQQAT